MAHEKEVHFFESDERFAFGTDWYESRFAAARPDQIAGEATPSYMAVPRAVERMARVVPDARLIAILRHPAERAYSMYWLARAWGGEKREPHEALRDAMHNPRASERASEYIGSYVDQLEHVQSFYPASALMVLLFDDFIEEPTAAARKVCGFLGADPSRVPADIGSFRNEPRRILNPRIHAFGERVKARNFRLGDRILRLNSQKVNYPPLSGPLRSELIEYFRPHNQVLSQRLERDLSNWNR